MADSMGRHKISASKQLSRRLGFRLRRATFALRRLFVSRLADQDVTPEQYLILVHLAERPAMSQRELAERSCTNPNTVKSILNHFERNGWARRTPSGYDRRVNEVSITPAGDRMRLSLIKVADEVTERALAQVPVEQRDVLLTALEVIAQTADEALNHAFDEKSRS